MKSAWLICVPTSPTVSTQPLTLCPPPEKTALAEPRCIPLLWCQGDQHETKSSECRQPAAPHSWMEPSHWQAHPWAWYCPFQCVLLLQAKQRWLHPLEKNLQNAKLHRQTQHTVGAERSGVHLAVLIAGCGFFPLLLATDRWHVVCIYLLLLWLSDSDNPRAAEHGWSVPTCGHDGFLPNFCACLLFGETSGCLLSTDSFCAWLCVCTCKWPAMGVEKF